MTVGWYYLHVNGSLIFKQDLPDIVADFRESDLVKMFWSFDTENREDAWQILVEALSAGASKTRIIELAIKWGCDNTDAEVYANRIGIKLFKSGDLYFASQIQSQENPCGSGVSCLEALADLCTKLGYRPQKRWSSGFTDLIMKAGLVARTPNE